MVMTPILFMKPLPPRFDRWIDEAEPGEDRRVQNRDAARVRRCLRLCWGTGRRRSSVAGIAVKCGRDLQATLSPSSCPPWQPERPGPTAGYRNRRQAPTPQGGARSPRATSPDKEITTHEFHHLEWHEARADARPRFRGIGSGPPRRHVEPPCPLAQARPFPPLPVDGRWDAVTPAPSEAPSPLCA